MTIRIQCASSFVYSIYFAQTFVFAITIYSAWSNASFYIIDGIVFVHHDMKTTISRLHCRWMKEKKNDLVVGKCECFSLLNPIKKYHDLWNKLVNSTLGTAYCMCMTQVTLELNNLLRCFWLRFCCWNRSKW